MKIPVPKTRVDLFYDVISPYAWISFETLLRYEKVWPIQLNLRPYFLVGVFNEAGAKSPVTIRNKFEHLESDIPKLNQYWGTKLVFREDFADKTMKNTSLKAQRMLAAVQIYEPEMLVPASRKFWERIWVDGKGVFTQEDVEKVANSLSLSDKDKILSAMKTDEVKNVIKTNVKDALETKCYGAPWVVVHLANGKKESFFGGDRMHLIAQTLGVPYYGPMKDLETTAKTQL